MKKLVAAGLASMALLIVGCSNGGNGTVGPPDLTGLNGNPKGSTPPPTKAASAALFQPSAGLLPYPYDVYFAGSTDGTLNIQPANALMPNQAAVNALDGFSTTAVIRERFGGPIDAASLATPGAVVVVHISTDNRTKGPVPPPTGVLVPLTGCVKGGACSGADYAVAPAGEDPTVLEITPLKPLAGSSCLTTGPANCATGEGYLVLLTNAITVGGQAAVPDTDYASFQAAIASGGAQCPSITDATLNPICRLTYAHLAFGSLLSVPSANVVVSFSFSTQSTVDTLTLLAATTTAQPLTVHPTGLNTSFIPPGLPGHADIYVGVLEVPYYLSKAAPLTAYWHAPPFPLDTSSTFVTRFNPLPVATATLKLPVLLTVPNASSTFGNVTPAGGWPVLIFQHGITRNREDMFAVADSFADQGFVVVAIDLPLHGITSQTDPLYAAGANPAYGGLGLPAAGSIERTFDLNTSGTAGAIDGSGTHFINLTNLLTSRDNLRQSAADLITLTRSLPGLSGVAGGVNANALHYLGHSLGGIVGGTLLGVIPAGEIVTATLANPGGEVAQLLRDSPSFAPQINAGLAAQGLVQGSTLYEQWWRDAQTVLDDGDPINFMALAASNHPIHLIQVVGSATPPSAAACIASPTPAGCPDQVVPNSATQRLILAGGLTQAHPPGTLGAQLDVFVNFTAGTHASILDPTAGSPQATIEMQTEAIAFALTSGTSLPVNGPPTAPVQ